MKTKHSFKLHMVGLSAIWLICLACSTAHCTLMLTTLKRFDLTNGCGFWTLTPSIDGCFYGVAEGCGQYQLGTVFRVTPDGFLSAIASFNGTNGADPQCGLIQGEAGVFYGATSFGGANVTTGSVYDAYGTIYRVTTNGNITTLHSFNFIDGEWPNVLTRGSDGCLYGTTFEGGPYTNTSGITLGTVFRVTTNGVFTNLAAFNGTNGALPLAELVEGTDGNFYGSTTRGGTADLGTMFRMTPSGTITTLVSFYGTNGSTPYAGLVQHRDGNFYGTTRYGGTSDNGTFFRMDTNGSLTVLASFDSTTGIWPRAPLALVDDSRFYGVTQFGGNPPSGQMGFGTVFEVTTNGVISPMVAFDFRNGDQPFCTLVKGTNGLYYGTTEATVFRLDEAVAPIIQNISRSNEWMTLTWTAVPDQVYKLEYTSTLMPPSWTDIPSATAILADNTNVTFEFSDADAQRFYRAVLRP